jgi:hypothetical protein
MANWRVEGDYFETCNCDYLCPCLPSNLSAKPTQGNCLFAMVFQINKGNHAGTSLDGLSFAVVGKTPGIMAEGNGSVGVIVDERANQAQRDAMLAIASGQAGGPMAALAPALPNFLGVEARPIRFTKNGAKRSVEIPGVLEQGIEATPSPSKPGEPLVIDNGAHPANPRVGLARATASHVHAFGFDWDETSGRNSGLVAPFSWQG